MMKSDIDKNFSRFFQIVMSRFWDIVVFLRLHESQNKRSHIFPTFFSYVTRDADLQQRFLAHIQRCNAGTML